MKHPSPSASEKLHNFKADRAWTAQLVKTLLWPGHSFTEEAGRKSAEFIRVSPPDLNQLFRKPSTSLFVWVPKTAGTSIFRWVESQRKVLLVKQGRDLIRRDIVGADLDMVAFGSMNIDSLVEANYLNKGLLDSRYSFAFVRNPYTRIASLYRYALKMGAIPKKTPFRLFLLTVARQKPTPGLYNWSGLSMASPMVNWLRQVSWAGPKQVFRVEDGIPAFIQLQKTLRLQGLPGRENETLPSLGPKKLTSFEINLVQDIFSEDFTTFGYSTEPPW